MDWFSCMEQELKARDCCTSPSFPIASSSSSSSPPSSSSLPSSSSSSSSSSTSSPSHTSFPVSSCHLSIEWRAPSLILPRLYLGSWLSANSFFHLQNLGITHILNLCGSTCLFPNEFVYKQIHLRDASDQDITTIMHECINFIHYARSSSSSSSPSSSSLSQVAHIDSGGILVHCSAGKSRSPSIVIGYLMYFNSMSLKDAIMHVSSIRAQAAPNIGFFKQLLGMELALRGKGSLDIEEYQTQFAAGGKSD